MIAQVGVGNLPDLMVEAWPSGVPIEERAIVADLNSARLEVAAKRLNTMLRYEQDGRWKDHVGPGLSRATFFSLLRAWRDRRSLASIVPRVAPHASGSRYGSNLAKVVAEVVENAPAKTRQALTGAVMAQLSKAPSESTLAGRVNRARAEQERQKHGGDDGFGRLVVVDASPVIMGTAGNGGISAAWAGFVYDVATGLTIAAGAAPDARSATLIACARAAKRISKLPSGGELRADFEVYLRDGDWRRLLKEERITVRAGFNAPWIEVRRPTARRSLGSRIMNLVGHRYGPVTLKPRLPIAGKNKVFEEVSRIPIIDARIDAEAGRAWEKRIGEELVAAVRPDDLVAVLQMLLRAEDFVSPEDG